MLEKKNVKKGQNMTAMDEATWDSFRILTQKYIGRIDKLGMPRVSCYLWTFVNDQLAHREFYKRFGVAEQFIKECAHIHSVMENMNNDEFVLNYCSYCEMMTEGEQTWLLGLIDEIKLKFTELEPNRRAEWTGTNETKKPYVFETCKNKNGVVVFEEIRNEVDSYSLYATYSPKGVKILEQSYFYNFLGGPSTYYYPSGVKQLEVMYMFDTILGQSTLYHPNGKVDSKGSWIYGERYGDWEYFDEEGQLVEIINWDYETNQNVDMWGNRTFPGENSKTKVADISEDTITYPQPNLITFMRTASQDNLDVYIDKYDYSSLVLGRNKPNYKSIMSDKVTRHLVDSGSQWDNNEHHLKTFAYDDGSFLNIHENGYFHEGRKCKGMSQEYTASFKDGIINSSTDTNFGELSLCYDIKYYKDGTREAEGPSFFGINNIGLWTYYHEDGSIQSFRTFSNYDKTQSGTGGIKVGEHHIFHGNGQLARKEVFKEGERHGLWTYFSEDGEKTMEETYKNDELVKLDNFLI